MTFHSTSGPEPAPFPLDTRSGEPRIRDLDLADRLKFAQPRDVRKLIERNTDELQTYAPLARHRGAPIRCGKGREITPEEFWLTEGQALVICALSRTPQAAAVRKLVIEVFMMWRAAHAQPAAAKPVPTPLVHVAHGIAFSPTADPEVMRVVATLPIAVANSLVDALLSYERNVVAGLVRQAH